ncbi:hypothetical protein ACFL4L_02900 [bacterium]
MDKLLEWFGRETYESRLQRIRAFWSGEGRFIVTVNTAAANYRKIFDEAKILSLAPQNLKAQSQLPGVNLPTFFADFGTISTAKYWGGTVRFDSTGENIFIDPVAENVEQALSIKPYSIDHEKMDALPALNLYKSVCQFLETESLWFRMPDFQGPLNTAGLVVNQENFLTDMYISPNQVHLFLQQVTEHLIRYAKYFYEHTEGRVCGYIWPYTFFPCDLGLAVTEDLMPILSPELYQEFGIPCLETLSDTFGSLQIHCCGDWGRHASLLKESRACIKAVEFHYPFTKIDELDCLVPETVFIPYISLEKQNEFTSVTHYYETLLTSTDEKYRFWFAFPEASEEAVAFIQRWT